MHKFKGLPSLKNKPTATIHKNHNALIDDLFYNIKFPFQRGFFNILTADNQNQILYYFDNSNKTSLYLEIYLVQQSTNEPMPIAIANITSSDTGIINRDNYRILHINNDNISKETIIGLIDTFHVTSRYIYLTGMYTNHEIIYSNFPSLVSLPEDTLDEIACSLDVAISNGMVKGHWRHYKSGKRTFIREFARKPKRKRKKRK